MSKQLREAITEAIRALAEGHGASLGDIALQAELMGLGCVVAEASNRGRNSPGLDVVAGVVSLFLEEAANALEEHPHAGTEPNRAAAARAALGLESGTQGKPLRGRRGQPGRAGTIARWLGYEPASVFKLRQDGRSAFDALVEDMAEHLTRREVTYRISEQRLAQQARRPPLESAMQVDWLVRFENYYRIWSYVAGVRNDVTVGIAHMRSDTPTETDYFVRKSLYYHACFLAELEIFTRERGGLWALPDPEAEQTVADATWMIREATPLTEIDESVLRLAIAGWKEIASFVQATHTDAALRGLVDNWRDWMRSCQCDDVERPKEDCAVHRCLGWAMSFMTTLDEQWDLLADWYEVARPESVVDAAVAPRPFRSKQS